MRPILFSKNATTFNTNGIGRLDPISAEGDETRNGEFVTEFEIAQTSEHANDIELNSIICAVPADDMAMQAFRVHKITKPINGRFKVYCQHISYQLSFIPTMPFSILASATACAQTLEALKNNAVEDCPFTFSTDVTTVASYTQTTPASIRSRLGGIEGSVIDQFGGEYEFDNYDVKLHSHRGVQEPTVTLRYGKNIIDLNQEEEIANVITGIVPFWVDAEGGERVTLPEKVVNSAYADRYPFKRTVPYDFSSAFEEKPTEAQLRAKAQAYVNQSGIGIPDVSIKVSFVALADTEEYKDIAPLEHVKLCDNVKIEFEEYGISTTAKVVKTQYDILAEKYISIELGSVRSSLASTISDTNNAIQGLANATQKNFGKLSNEVQADIDNATTWLTDEGGYVIAIKDQQTGAWQSLLFTDNDDPTEWHNVLRINKNGIGFSSDGGQTYTQAWTLDGKLVIGGTNVPSITVYDNNNNIIFKADATAMVWNASNSSMNSSGVITATGASLTNATIANTDTSSYSIKINGSSLVFGRNGTDYATVNLRQSGSTAQLKADVTGDIYEQATKSVLMKVQSGNTNYSQVQLSNDGNIYMSANDSIQLRGYNHGIQAFNDIDVNLAKVTGKYSNGGGGIIEEGQGGEVRFSDIMNSSGGNITMNGKYAIIEADYVTVRDNRNSGQYHNGYTGSFSLRTSSGGTATLQFVNGILV